MVEFTTGFHDEGTPSGTSQGIIIDEEFVSNKSSLRSIIGNEHEFNTAAADHVRGTHKKGSARAFLDVQSNMSVSGTSYVGRLYVASDTSRLFAIPDSGQTIFLGSANISEIASYKSAGDAALDEHYPGQNARWVQQCGFGRANDASSRTGFVFSPAYDNPPVVIVTPYQTSGTGKNVTVSAVSVGGFLTDGHILGTGSATDTDFYWMSMGTVSF